MAVAFVEMLNGLSVLCQFRPKTDKAHSQVTTLQ
jgi:hypothetical protein